MNKFPIKYYEHFYKYRNVQNREYLGVSNVALHGPGGPASYSVAVRICQHRGTAVLEHIGRNLAAQEGATGPADAGRRFASGRAGRSRPPAAGEESAAEGADQESRTAAASAAGGACSRPIDGDQLSGRHVSGTGRSTAPLLDTPQSITVVPQQIIREQASSTVMDALRNVPGITFRAGEGGAQGDTPYIRGFDARNDIFRDGVARSGLVHARQLRRRQRRGAEGPVVVHVRPRLDRRRDQPEHQVADLRQRAGGHQRAGMPIKAPLVVTAPSADFVDMTVTGHTGPGVRSVARRQQADQRERRGAHPGDGPALRHSRPRPCRGEPLGRRAVVHLQVQRTDARDLQPTSISTTTAFRTAAFPTCRRHWAPAGTVFPIDVPRNTWYGIKSGPDPDQEKIDAHVATARFVHEFTNDIKITNTTRYVNVDRLNRATLPNNPQSPVSSDLCDDHCTGPAGNGPRSRTNCCANNTDFSAKFITGWLRHSLVAGVDIAREERSQSTRGNVANSAAADQLHQSGSLPVRRDVSVRYGPTTISDANSVGAYLADQVKITEWFELLGGVRYDNFDAKSGRTTRSCRADRQDVELARRRRVPSDEQQQHLRDARNVVQSDRRVPDDRRRQPPISHPEKNETTEVGVKVDVLGQAPEPDRRGVPDRQDQCPRAGSGNLHGHCPRGPRACRGHRAGRDRPGHRPVAGLRRLHAPASRRSLKTPDRRRMLGKELLNTPQQRVLAVDDLRRHQTMDGRRRRVLRRCDVCGNADQHRAGAVLLALRCDDELQDHATTSSRSSTSTT